MELDWNKKTGHTLGWAPVNNPPAAVQLAIIKFCVCKYCNDYTTPPELICLDSIYCNNCSQKYCFNCCLRMEADLLKRLITYHEPFNLELDLSLIHI